MNSDKRIRIFRKVGYYLAMVVVVVVVVRSFDHFVEENQRIVMIELHQTEYLDFVNLNVLVMIK
jgi:hypothetical protein